MFKPGLCEGPAHPGPCHSLDCILLCAAPHPLHRSNTPPLIPKCGMPLAIVLGACGKFTGGYHQNSPFPIYENFLLLINSKILNILTLDPLSLLCSGNIAPPPPCQDGIYLCFLKLTAFLSLTSEPLGLGGRPGIFPTSLLLS